uniref:Bmp-like protein n=1 Tax=Schmidtea mediterranea TaxID=79327 RepID=U3RF22_SCHMD|nr:bmp-like protein [Schmidtea mediterranea]
MSTYKMVPEQVIIFFILSSLCVMGSWLPKFVDQQLNNQVNEAVSSVMLPLQAIPCSSGDFVTNCFMIERFPQPRLHEWQFLEFQVSAHSSTVMRTFKLIVFDEKPDSERKNVIFESASVEPDPILMDIIIDITTAKLSFLRYYKRFYFQLICTDCIDQSIRIANDNAIAFIIIKQTRIIQRRLRRSVEDRNKCLSDSNTAHCCIQTVFTEKHVAFENGSHIIAPHTIPITYCRGQCYSNTYEGNNNYVLIRYLNSLADRAKIKMYKQLPCCSARKFRDLMILYRTPDGNNRMEASSNLLVDLCKCQ